jgi:hypothetical protein
MSWRHQIDVVYMAISANKILPILRPARNIPTSLALVESVGVSVWAQTRILVDLQSAGNPIWAGRRPSANQH